MSPFIAPQTQAEIPQNVDPEDILTNDTTLKNYLIANGPKKTLSTLLARSLATNVDCHQPAHRMGRLGFKLYGKEVFQESSATCHSGAYHGAMEGFLNANGTTNLAQDITKLCKEFQTTFGTFSCLHGTGHGVLAYLDYDVPGALVECKKLADDWSQSSCFGGVFMENILTALGQGAGSSGHKTSWVNQTDRQFPCDGVDQDLLVQQQCYMMQTSQMFTIENWNFDTVAKDCLQAKSDMISTCFQSFGRDIAGHVNRDPQQILTLCKKSPAQYQDICVIEALNVVIEFWGPDLTTQATELCKLTSINQKGVCYTTINSRLSDVFNDKDRQKLICQNFEKEYQPLCAQYL